MVTQDVTSRESRKLQDAEVSRMLATGISDGHLKGTGQEQRQDDVRDTAQGTSDVR